MGRREDLGEPLRQSPSAFITGRREKGSPRQFRSGREKSVRERKKEREWPFARQGKKWTFSRQRNKWTFSPRRKKGTFSRQKKKWTFSRHRKKWTFSRQRKKWAFSRQKKFKSRGFLLVFSFAFSVYIRLLILDSKNKKTNGIMINWLTLSACKPHVSTLIVSQPSK